MVDQICCVCKLLSIYRLTLPEAFMTFARASVRGSRQIGARFSKPRIAPRYGSYRPDSRSTPYKLPLVRTHPARLPDAALWSACVHPARNQPDRNFIRCDTSPLFRKTL